MIKEILISFTKIIIAVLIILLVWTLFSFGFQHIPMKQTIVPVKNNYVKVSFTMPRGTDFRMPIVSDKPISFKGKMEVYQKHKLVFQKNISNKQAWHTKNEQNREMYDFGRLDFLKQYQTYDIVYQFEYIDIQYNPAIILWWADCGVCGYI